MDYYKKHVNEFIEDTFNVDMSEHYRFFERHLIDKGVLLDIGFGSGRDSLYFKSKGYEVYSIDPEEEFIKHAKEIGLDHVYKMKAEDIDFIDKFDGIWACASLLHVSSKNLKETFRRCADALKDDGVMYASFKYGVFEGERNGRYYLDLNEESIKQFTDLSVVDVKITEDVRPNRVEKWLNVILRK